MNLSTIGTIRSNTSDCLTDKGHNSGVVLSVSTLLLTIASSTLFIAIIKRRRSAPSFAPFLLSISIADLVLCLTVLPVAIIFTSKKYNRVQDASILCLLCAFPMQGLRCAKTLTYFTASFDGYLMVSSSRYRRHFQEEIKSSFAILLWILSGVYQVVMVLAGFGRHVFDCQLGLCVFQLQNIRSFIVVHCVNTIVVTLSIIMSVVAVRKGKKKASLVAPLPQSEIAGPSTDTNKVTELDSDSTEFIQNSNYVVQRLHRTNEFKMDDFLPNCIPLEDTSSQMGTSICHSIARDKYDNVFCVDVANTNKESKKEEIRELENATACETETGEKVKVRESHQNETYSNLAYDIDNPEPEKSEVNTSVKYPVASIIESLSHETPRSSYLDLTPSVICFDENNRHNTPSARQNLVPGRSLLKCYSHVFAHLLSLLVFVLCWGPYHVILILQSLFDVQCPRGIRFALMWLGLVSGILNVIVYPCFHIVLNKNLKILWRQLSNHIRLSSINKKANNK